jgi:beta-mannosidase
MNHSTELQTTWYFTKGQDTSRHPASVPGVIHQDLITNGWIEHPYLNNNELETEWVEREDWVYSAYLNIDKEMLKNDHIELVFEGLDTYAEVFINDTLRLTADNMFRTWKLDVRPFVQEGGNPIRIAFTSPMNKNGEYVENYKYKLPSGNETVSTKVGSFTRKAAYHFGWDWGPRVVTSGIWKPIRINVWNNARIFHINTQTRSIEEGKATISVQLEIEVDKADEYQIHLNDQQHTERLDTGLQLLEYDLTIDNPKLWWPNGLGDQPLYPLHIVLKKGRSVIDQTTKKFGIRTVELVHKNDSIGKSYFFKVNGKPFFAKGANYIPQDMLLPEVSADRYRKTLQLARDANMNMLRVWGGGIYENDLFYDLCDQYGLMIWQDFMFAGSMYPTDSSFHESVIAEAKDNIRRIRSHPSLALWCGNNEIEVAWRNWGWQNGFRWSAADSAEIWENYVKIFREELPAQVMKLNPEVPYVPTSPLSNWGKEQNFNYSSMHYWGVWHGREPFEKFKENVPRFMVEYGFQSFPSYRSLVAVIDSAELQLESKTMTNRQKSYIGNGMITLYAKKYFGKPKDFPDYIDQSQKTQAIAYRMAIQAHRLGKPHCMGTLFWQLNDCWQGPSWSVIEYDGTPKRAYDEVKKWYQPVIAVVESGSKNMRVKVVSDLPETATLTLEIVSDEQTIYSTKFTITNMEVKQLELPSIKHPFQINVYNNGQLVFTD